MAIFEISSPWHNPQNPKCRSCKFYQTEGDYWLSGKCINAKSKAEKHRYHNSKACIQFRRPPNQYQGESWAHVMKWKRKKIT